MEQLQNGSGAVLGDTSRLKRPAEEVGSSETKKLVAMLPNGLHREANDAGTPTTTARVYSRKRGRETPDSAVKKAKQAKRAVAPEEKVDGILGRTADILLVLAGLRQINSGKPTSKVEAQLAADAQRNLECLVARTTPSSILSKNSLENMLETLNFRLTADNRIEASPRPKVEKLKADDQEANLEGENSEANNSGPADNTGSLLSPGILSWEDDTETDLKQTDDYEEYPDAYMRHKQLVKVVQQLKAEPAAPRTLLPISNAYTNLAGHCGSCQAIVKETSNVLVCDSCEKIYHQKCIAQYYLKFHPKGDWYCPKCISDGNGKPPKYGPVRKTSGGTATTPSRGSIKPVALESVVSNGPSPSQDQQQQIQEEEAKAEELEETTAADDVRAEESEPAAEEDMSVQDAAEGVSPQEAQVSPEQQPSFVQWIGEPRVLKDRTFYSGFTMLGCTFKVRDCALFHPDPPDAPPFIARLQAMWEEHQTNRKLVRVNWCYYPNDNQLPPDVPGRPETWEPDEVYESNHCDDNIIESIQGPCQVLSPQKYREETQRRAKLVASGLSEDLPPIYQCRWSFDVREAAFRKTAED